MRIATPAGTETAHALRSGPAAGLQEFSLENTLNSRSCRLVDGMKIKPLRRLAKRLAKHGY